MTREARRQQEIAAEIARKMKQAEKVRLLYVQISAMKARVDGELKRLHDEHEMLAQGQLNLEIA